MKQGRTDTKRAGWKREPIPHAVHESAVADLGESVQYEKKDLYAGKGFKHDSPRPARAGPGGGREIHPHGSQGKHK